MTGETMTAPQPALTPSEWQIVEAHEPITTGGFVRVTALAEERLIIESDRKGILVDTDDLPGLIALANHALPDGRPLKLTRRMAEVAQWAMLTAQDEAKKHALDSAHRHFLHVADDARALYEAITALLPPDA